MSGGLKQQWALREPQAGGSTESIKSLQDIFKHRLATINREITEGDGKIEPEAKKTLEADRDRLYETYVKAAKIAEKDPDKAKETIESATEEATTFQTKAFRLRTNSAQADEAWRKVEPDFERARDEIDLLDAYGHEAAAGLLVHVREIDEAVQARRWLNAVALYSGGGESLETTLAKLRAAATAEKSTPAPDDETVETEAFAGIPIDATLAPNTVEPDIAPEGVAATIETAPPADDEAGDAPPAIKKDLSGSVGQGGKNSEDDVKTVQQLLNDQGASLEVDGLVGPKTIGAIKQYQQKNLGFADGLVDPGGKTWQSLTAGGGTATPGPTGQDDLGGGNGGGDGGGGGPTDGGGDNGDSGDEGGGGVPEQKGEDAPDDDSPPGDAPWFDAETEIKSPLGSIKIKTDAHGNVTGGALVVNSFPLPPLTLAIPPYALSFEGKPAVREAVFQGTGPVVDATIKLGCEGAGAVIFGAAGGSAVAGFKVELSLSSYVELVQGEVDLDNRVFEFTGPGFPIEIFLKGEIKAGVTIEAGDFGISHMVEIREYDKILIASVSANFDFDLRAGPGLDQIVQDIENQRQQVLDAVAMAEENPETAGTGPQPISEDEFEGLADKPKKAESFKDKIDETVAGVADQITIMELRQAEAAMESAYQAGWADPTLVGKANALTQKDEATAKQIYGQAWTQRALAKQSYDSYGSPLDSADLSIINARKAQAQSIAGKFQTAISLFHQGDASW